MQDATFIAFGGREPICCIIKPIKERLPALLLGMQSSKEENEQACLYSHPRKMEGPRSYARYMGSLARAEWPTVLSL